MLNSDVSPQELVEAPTPDWSPDAPRGGKTVLNRILKEGATVPLFFAQTLIASLRDVGYNHTTSALCEHVDNALQAGATEIRIFLRQSGKKGGYETDAAVYDNGRGMSPAVLKVATAFGGSMTYGNRQGIGRFGMGMKTAALSMSPILEIYSWQEPNAIYNMTLDVEAIGRDRGNLVELPDPTLMTDLPDHVSELFTKAMSYPADRSEQALLANASADLQDRLGKSGTIVYMPSCDRLSYAKARTLVDHAVKEMARVYRRAIAGGVKLYVNNRRVEVIDPTYSMPMARHTNVEEISVKQSRLIVSKVVQIKKYEHGDQAAPIIIKLYALPFEEWSDLPRKILRNDLRVFDGHIISILRNDREVFAGVLPEIVARHSVANWSRLQIDFPGDLDEAFGVAANKQGVRPKGYVLEAINSAIGSELSALNDEIKRFQGSRASSRPAGSLSQGESKASEADPYQMKPLDPQLSAEEEAQMEANLRGLAVTLKRDDETDDQAFERVRSAKYLITYRHDDYWPFYHVEHRFGRVILTINTAHPFFSQLYDPLRKGEAALPQEDDGDEAADVRRSLVTALELLLLSLARAQSIVSYNNDDARVLLDSFRREWSESYRIQLTM